MKLRGRRGRITAIAVGVAIAAAGSGFAIAATRGTPAPKWGGTADGVAPALPDAARGRQLMAIISADARYMNGGTAPTPGEIYGSTDAIAAKALSNGGLPDTNRPVYVVTLHGNFTGYLASVPPGHALPHGHLLTTVFDADTNQVIQWQLSENLHDVGALGLGVPADPNQ